MSADDVMVATFPVSACQRVSADDVTVAMALLMRPRPRGIIYTYCGCSPSANPILHNRSDDYSSTADVSIIETPQEVVSTYIIYKTNIQQLSARE